MPKPTRKSTNIFVWFSEKPQLIGWALIISACVLSLIVRLVNIELLPIFADESIYVRWSQIMAVEPGLRFLPLSDGKQPLFMWLTIPSLKLVSDPLVAGRVVSAFAGVATVLGTSLLAFVLFKNVRIAAISALLGAFLPFFVFFDRLAMADTLLSAFLVWGVLFLSISVSKQRFDFSLLAGFAFGGAWLTKSPAAILIVASLLLAVLFSPPGKKHFIKSVYYWLCSGILAFALYNILRLGPEFHMIAIRNADYVWPIQEIIKHPFDPLVPHLKAAINFYWIYLTPFMFIFSIWGLADTRRVHLKVRLILAGLVLIPLIGQTAIAKTLTARYLLYTVPYLVILAAHALDHLGAHTKKHFLTYSGTALIVVLSFFHSLTLVTEPASFPMPASERSGYLEEWTSGFGLKQISIQIAEFAKTEKNIVVGAEGFFGTPFSALQMYLNNYPNVRVVGVGIPISGVDDKLKSALDQNRVFLVLNESRLTANPDEFKPKLELIDSHPKAARPDGTRDKTLFFEVYKP